MNTQIFIGWKYRPESKSYHLAIIHRANGEEDVYPCDLQAWPKSDQQIAITFKFDRKGSCCFVYIHDERDSKAGFMEVIECSVDTSSSLQSIIYPRFVAGQGAPQNLLIRIKHGQA